MHFPHPVCVCKFWIVSILLMFNLYACKACRYPDMWVSGFRPIFHLRSSIIMLLCRMNLHKWIPFIWDNYSHFTECINGWRMVATFVCTWPPTPNPKSIFNIITYFPFIVANAFGNNLYLNLFCLFVSLMNHLMTQIGTEPFLQQLSCIWIRGKNCCHGTWKHAEWECSCQSCINNVQCNFINYNSKRRFSISVDCAAAAAAAVVTRPINLSFAANKRT